jgi:TATA-binding protein-associated factor Taf7
MNQQMWGDMLDVLKDIGAYLAKQDAIQERASVDKAPKISESQKPIKGDSDVTHGFGPGKGVAKSALLHKYVDVPEEGRAEGQETFTPDNEETSELSKEAGEFEERFHEEPDGDDEGEEYSEEEEDGDEEEEGMNDEEGYGNEPSGQDINELKSLLKDIRKSLISKSKPATAPVMSKEYLKKAIQPMIKEEAQRMIRKMGFSPSRPDVIRFGVDDNSALQKSMDSKKESDAIGEAGKIVGELSEMSWTKLGALREQTGQFRPFN